MMPAANIVPIILAAGDSIRMGYPKAILPLGSDTFIARILGTLKEAELPKPIVVLGRAASIIRPFIADRPAEIVINADPDRGQLSSIQLALSHIDPACTGGMIWPVDQPAISKDLVCRIVRLFTSAEPKIAFPVHGNKNGHPAIFHRDLFREFMEVSPDVGPRLILSRYRDACAILPAEESACVQDIDTPEDYLNLTGESLDSVLAKLNIHKSSPRENAIPKILNK